MTINEMFELETKMTDIKARMEEARKRRAAQQKRYRENPDLLALAIANNIRSEQLFEKQPKRGKNPVMSWVQSAWGTIGRDRLRLDSPVQIENFGYQEKFYEASCPTTGCVAGWADTLAGYPMVISASYVSAAEELGEQKYETSQCLVEGKVASISDTARDLLRLDSNQSYYLFDSIRSVDEVLAVLDQIAAGNYDWVPLYDSDDSYPVADDDEDEVVY